MEATLFDFAAERLGHHTGFDRLEARGTLRIALKSGGIEPKSLTLDQLAVVFKKVMPGELEKRGVSDTASVCTSVTDDLANAPATTHAEPASDPDEIFRRLANG